MEMNKVLIAAEDSFFGRALVDFVVRHYWMANTQFLLLHVIEPAPPYDISDESWYRYHANETKAGQTLIDEMASTIRTAFPESQIETDIQDGNPKEQIIARAIKWDPDLIVMGSHGRCGLKKTLLGSVSQDVASRAPCSVLIVRPPATRQGKKKSAKAVTVRPDSGAIQ